jgi:hypothetical protein
MAQELELQGGRGASGVVHWGIYFHLPVDARVPEEEAAAEKD